MPISPELLRAEELELEVLQLQGLGNLIQPQKMKTKPKVMVTIAAFIY